MERITSCESTLSELVTLSSHFSIDDRVRRIGGSINVPTDIKLIGSGTSGTVRYVGPLCKKQEEVGMYIINSNNTNMAAATATGGIPMPSGSSSLLMPNDSSTTSLSPSDSAPASPSIPLPPQQQQPPIYIGVEWDQKVGKNDGTVEGIRYFTCEPGYGSLLLPKNLSKGLPLATLLEARYGSSTVRQEAGTITTADAERNTQTRPLQLGPAIGFRDPETGAFVKVVNCDCTANEQLGLASTCGGDRLGMLFPNLRDLSVAGTLIASWDELKMIVTSLPNLVTLDVSRNPALGAPTLNKEKQRDCFPLSSNDNTNNNAMILSTSVRELRISDVGLLTPDCVEFILCAFPSLEAFFAARNNLTMKGHPKRGANAKSICSYSSRNESEDTAAASQTPLNNSQTHQPQSHQRVESTSVLSTKSQPQSSSSSSSALKYLNVEGNEGIEYLADIVDLIGLDRCPSLTALNVSATGITDAPHLPPVASDLIEKLPNNYFNQSSLSSSSGNTSNNTSPAKNHNLINDQQQQQNTSSNLDSPLGSNNGSADNTTSELPTQPPPPLFPNLSSLYMSKLRVYSWLSLSRLLHRAADCIHGTLVDVHFSTTITDEDQGQRRAGEEEDLDDGLSTTADENYYDTASSSVAFNNEDGDGGSSFLPEDFRDRRRMSVAFMPSSVKKFNRSEISTVERSSAITRSIPAFYQLVKRVEVKNADDPENAEEVEIIDPKRLGDLPRHLQKLVVKEHIRTTKAISNAGSANSTASTGVGFIYRPASIGPRKLVNAVEVNIRCVLMNDKNHLSLLRRDFFKSVLEQAKEEDEAENSNSSSSNNQNSNNNNCRRNLSSKQFGKLRMKVDVRWETQQLEEAVREALGMESPTASSSSSSAGKNATKKTPIALFHIDKELMDNAGAVAQGLHCKHLARAWEKLFVTKISENDDVIACVGP